MFPGLHKKSSIMDRYGVEITAPIGNASVARIRVLVHPNGSGGSGGALSPSGRGEGGEGS